MVGENEAPDLLKDRDSAIPRFESWRPSQPVRSAPRHILRPPKTARYRMVSQIWRRKRLFGPSD